MRSKKEKEPRGSTRGTVILQMRDGTTRVIEGDDLCLDIALTQDGQPHLVVRERDRRRRRGQDKG